MGSVTSPLNPGIATLLQSFTKSNSALSSELTSPTVEAALQNAPPAQIAQLSNQSSQLLETDALFGSPQTSAAPSSLSSLFPATSDTTPNSILPSLDASILSAASPAPSSNAAGAQPSTTAGQFAGTQNALDAQQVQDLFASDVNSGSSPLVNVLA